ncbi:GGDEF domain-containing protein [Novosphingobium decolorationis]|uniref:diguanylate cyclase n=1 Tax=Novosphingobium decolorationis TaxID=2698673 RepID=A0ABX8E8M9_9SPHN|nr:GGDEF domain-containing protein [Novosphingobium decolorationis]QVM85419.1 GGDEF domain-containing protein [Novosphingobium decolorationis]
MRFYNATTFLFRRHYEWRILFICFFAVHVPLLATLAFQAFSGGWSVPTLIVVLGATLAGTIFGVLAIHGLLSPIRKATNLLRAIQAGEHPGAIPTGSDDLVGRLLDGVIVAAHESSTRIARLETLSEHDPLTGLLNRRGFRKAAECALSRPGNAVLALIDLDHFKLVNDRFGHEAGDTLLRKLAQALEADLRRSDVCCRWGGEEFALLFPDTLVDEARLVMERLRASIALDTGLLDEAWPVTLSCGLAPLRSLTELDEASRRADAALYEAKEAGRNRVRIARS